jgi:hypothetical protein
MKKGFFVFLALAMITTGGVFGQAQGGLFDTILDNMGLAPGLEDTRFFVNGGAGLEAAFFSVFEHNMPPLSVSVDYVLPATPVSFGGKVAFSTVKYSGERIEKYSGERIEDCVNVDMALRMAVHSKILAMIENFDVTALILIGFDFATGDVFKSIKDSTAVNNFDGLYLGVGLGARYFFTRNIGAFLEADLKALVKFSVGASAGLSLKF